MRTLFKNLPKPCSYVSLLTLSCAFFTAQQAFSEPYQYQYRSARFLGRGDTGISDATGADAMFYNPANLSMSKKNLSDIVGVSPQIEASNNSKEAYDKYKQDDQGFLNYALENKNKPIHIAGQNVSALVFQNMAFAAMQRGEGNVLVSSDPYTGMPAVNLSGRVWNGGYVSLSHAVLNERLYLGVTGKYIQKRQLGLNLTALEINTEMSNNNLEKKLMDSQRKGNGLGADVGATFVVDKESQTHVGMSVRNLGTTSYNVIASASGQPPDSDLQEINIGASTSWGTKKNFFKFLVDYRDVLDAQQETFIKHLHAGAEYNLENMVFLMAGLNDGYLTYGGGLNFKVIKVEAGSYIQEEGQRAGQTPSTRYFGRISLGWMI